MAMKHLFVEQAIKVATEGQAALVDFLTEDNPIIENLPMEGANKGMQDVYEVLNQADEIPLTELDAPLTALDAATKVEQTNLKQWAGKIIAGEDKIKDLGFGKNFAGYFADKSPKIFRTTGNSLSRTIYYNSLRAYAIANYTADNTRVINAGGSTADSQFSITAVKWTPGEITGLYNKEGWGDGKIFDIADINGGNLYEDPTTKVLVYGKRMKLNMGMKLANPRYVASIVNIQNNADLTSAGISLDDKLSDLIVRARNANAIYMHPSLLQKLGTAFKSDKLRFVNNDNDINNIIAFWDGVRIISDFNLDYGTEAVVTL